MNHIITTNLEISLADTTSRSLVATREELSRLLDDSGSFAVAVRTQINAAAFGYLRLCLSAFANPSDRFSGMEIPPDNHTMCYGSDQSISVWGRDSFDERGLVPSCSRDDFSDKQLLFLRTVRSRAWFPIADETTELLFVLFRDEEREFTMGTIAELWIHTQYEVSQMIARQSTSKGIAPNKNLHRQFVDLLDASIHAKYSDSAAQEDLAGFLDSLETFDFVAKAVCVYKDDFQYVRLTSKGRLDGDDFRDEIDPPPEPRHTSDSRHFPFLRERHADGHRHFFQFEFSETDVADDLRFQVVATRALSAAEKQLLTVMLAYGGLSLFKRIVSR